MTDASPEQSHDGCTETRRECLVWVLDTTTLPALLEITTTRIDKQHVEY